jgi:hypothetical protein
MSFLPASLGQHLIYRNWRVSLTDADVLVGYSVGIFLAAVVGRWVGAVNPALDSAVRVFDVADVNAGEAMAACAMVSVGVASRHRLSLTARDYLVIAAATLLFLVPIPQNLPFVGATLAGAYFWRFRRDAPDLVSFGQLWIAVSAHAAWGKLFFRIMSVPILHLETLTIAEVGKAIGLGLTVAGAKLAAPSGWSVYILDPCSCFHNLSLAVLVWLSLLKLGREAVATRAWVALLTGSFLIIALNASRILLMTLSEAQYQYWHYGLGRSFFVCLTFAAIAVPTLVLIPSRARSQRVFATRSLP